MKKIALIISLVSLSAGSTIVAADVTDTVFAIGKVGTGFLGMYYGGNLFTRPNQSLSNKVIGASLFLAGASLACNKEQQALALITSGLAYARNNVLNLISKSPTPPPPPATAANTASSTVPTPQAPTTATLLPYMPQSPPPFIDLRPR